MRWDRRGRRQALRVASLDNKLLVLDAKTGKATGEEIAVPAPVGALPLDDHALLGRQRQAV